MKNTLTDLNNHLFEALERLNDDDLTDEQIDREVKRSKAVADVANVIVTNAHLQLKVAAYAEDYGFGMKHGSKLPEVLEMKK